MSDPSHVAWCASLLELAVTTKPGEYPDELECCISGEAVDLCSPDAGPGWASDMIAVLLPLLVQAHNHGYTAGRLSVLGEPDHG